MLLDLKFFRRDQIWFAEKDDRTCATELYSLVSFSPRKGENVRKGYLQGRFGAIPFIGGDTEWVRWGKSTIPTKLPGESANRLSISSAKEKKQKRFIIITVKYAPKLISVLWIIICLRNQRFCVFYQMFSCLVLWWNRYNIHQAIPWTEMFEIKRFCFLSFTDDIDDRFTLTPDSFIRIVFLPHLTHSASPPIKGIAPNLPWR